jgi:transposase
LYLPIPLQGSNRHLGMDLVPSNKKSRKKPVRKAPAHRKPPENYEQGELIGRTMAEMVGREDPVRTVKPLLRLVNVKPFEDALKLLGAPSYSTAYMLILWIFALWDGERSSRKIEKLCKHDVRYMYLMDGQTPDHVTINRFRKALGKERLRQLIVQTIELGKAAGVTSLGRASLDGTKLPSAGTQWIKYLTEAEVAALEDGAESEPPGEEPATEGKTPAKKKKKTRPRKASTDPEARIQRLTIGGYTNGYNGQVLVDCDSELILTTHVTNCASDSGELTAAMSECLESYGELPAELLADAGYDTPANAEALAECGVTGWVSSKDKNSVWSLSPEGKPVCPAGFEALHPERFNKNGAMVLRLSVRACGTCERQDQCEASDRKTMSFPVGVDISHQLRQRERAKTEEAKDMRIQRACTSELTFAQMKSKLGLKRLHLRGLEGAETELGLTALAFNFVVLARKIGRQGFMDLIAQLRARIWTVLEHPLRTYRSYLLLPHPFAA